MAISVTQALGLRPAPIVVPDPTPDPTPTPDPDPGSGTGSCSVEEVANYQCPAGYVLWNNACIKEDDPDDYFKIPHAVGYDVEYYEHAGELVGKYNLMPVSVGGCTVPIYFDQNVKVEELSRMSIAPSININKSESVILMGVEHTSAGNGATLDIPALSRDTESNRNSFLFGEFFCLQNTVSAIKSINLHYDLIDNRGIPYSDQWLGLKTDSPALPDNSTIDPNSFIEWSLGFGNVPRSSRLDEFKPEITGLPVTPSMANPVLATGWMKWDSMRPTCFTWLQVHDKFDLNEYLSDSPIGSGQYVVQLKATVNEAKLAEFLSNAVDHLTYEEEGKRDYQLVFYPPSFYSFPASAVDELKSPNLNSVNTHLDDIIFPAPDNYKSDGNIHYTIEFLTAKNRGTILFETSSFGQSSGYEPLHWSWSTGNDRWKGISEGSPTFNNEFFEDKGSDVESALYIKYELSSRAKAILLERPDVMFRIKQIDGTLTA